MLDRTFSALADLTRRAILARLAEGGGVTVGVLAEPFAVSLPGVIKHLDVLCAAGLVTRTRTGRNVTCRIAATPMSEAMAWLDRQLRFWETRLDALATFAEAAEKERNTDDDQERAGGDRGPRSG